MFVQTASAIPRSILLTEQIAVILDLYDGICMYILEVIALQNYYSADIPILET